MVDVELIVSNPTEVAIDQFVEYGLSSVDKALSVYLHKAPNIRRLVFEIKDGDVELLFGVLKDCRPVKATVSMRQILDEQNDR